MAGEGKAIAEILITFRTKAELAEFRKFQGALKAGKKDLTSFQKASEKVTGALKGMVVAYAGLAGARAALNFVKESIQLAMKQEQVELSRNAALERQGKLTRENIRLLNQHAAAMQTLTGISNDVVVSIQDLLLGFNVAAEDIPLATQAVADFASTVDISVVEAARRLGRTLGGSVEDVMKAVPAVKMLTRAQLEAGDAIIIVAEALEGKAAAAMEGGRGDVTSLKNAFEDLQKVLGSVAEGDGVAGAITNTTEAINLLTDSLGQEGLSKVLSSLLPDLDKLFAILPVGGLPGPIKALLADFGMGAIGDFLSGSAAARRTAAEESLVVGRSLTGDPGAADKADAAEVAALLAGMGPVATTKPRRAGRRKGPSAEDQAAEAKKFFALIATTSDEFEQSRIEASQRAGDRLDDEMERWIAAEESAAMEILGLRGQVALIGLEGDEAIQQQRIGMLDELRMLEEQGVITAESAALRRVLVNADADEAIAAKRMAEAEAVAGHLGDVGAEMIGIMQMDREEANEAMQSLAAKQAAFFAAKGIMEVVPPPFNFVLAPIAAAAAHALIMSFHGGGIVGQGGQPLGGIALPPRRPDEVDTRLQKGEVVFSREDVARGGGAAAVNASRGQMGGGTPVVVNITTNDAKSIDDWFRRGDGQRAIQRAVDRGDLRLR